MPAVSSILAATALTVGAIGAGVQYKAGKDQRADAKDAAKDMKRREAQEKKKAAAAEGRMSAGGYGSSLGAGAQTLGG